MCHRLQSMESRWEAWQLPGGKWHGKVFFYFNVIHLYESTYNSSLCCVIKREVPFIISIWIWLCVTFHTAFFAISAWRTRVILPGEKALMVDRLDTKIILYVPYTNKHNTNWRSWEDVNVQITATSCCCLRVLCCKSQGPWFNSQTRFLYYVLHMFLMLYDIYCMVWYGIFR